MTTDAAVTDPQIAARMDTQRREAQRWHDQMRAAEYGYCPAPINQKPFDMYDVYSSTFTGNEPLRVALARTDGHVFVATDTDTEAWCIRCDHPARIWPEARVFIVAGTPCPGGDEPGTGR